MAPSSRIPKVELLIGPIASGKSTYSRRRALEGAIVINDDAIVNALHCNNYSLYRESLKPIYKAVENAILQSALALGNDVIIDRPNYSRAMRRRYIGIAKSLDANVEFIVFPTASDEEHARRRCVADARGYTMEDWLRVVKIHKAQYESPSLSEGADAIRELSNEDLNVT